MQHPYAPFGLHRLEPKLLLANPSLVGHLLRQMVPLEFPQVFDVPYVIMVVIALPSPDDGVVQALRNSYASESKEHQDSFVRDFENS